MTGTPSMGSLFSGLGGFDAAANDLGLRVLWQVENEKFCRKLLSKHWPEVTRYGDVSAVDFERVEQPNIVTAGFPCQDLSVAGKRAGLSGDRSGLFHEVVRAASVLRPNWLVLENVPGLLSSNTGGDMGVVVHALRDLGYLGCWRVLDGGGSGSRGWSDDTDRMSFVARPLLGKHNLSHDDSKKTYVVSPAVTARQAKGGFCDPVNDGLIVTHALTANGADASEDGTGRGVPLVLQSVNRGEKAQNGGGVSAGPSYSLNGRDQHAVAISGCATPKIGHEINGSLRAEREGYIAFRPPHGMTVRRLSPTECERLMNLPDGWTCLCGLNRGRSVAPEGEKPCRCADGPRYRSLGNAVVRSWARWILNKVLEAETTTGGIAQR